MSDVSKFIEDLVGAIHGKTPATIPDDGKKLLVDVEAFTSGLMAAGPYAPTIVLDVTKLAAEIAEVAASRGLNLPADVAAGSTLVSLAQTLAAAETALMAEVARYQATAKVVASSPSSP